MRFETIGLVLRVGQRIAGEREDGVDNGLAGEAVVAMRERTAVGVPGDHRPGLEPAQLAHDASAHLGRVLDEAVGVAQEDELLDAEHVTGGALFFLADLGQLFAGQRGVFRAHVAARREQVVDVPAFGGPPGGGATAEKLRVVRVSDDDERRLRVLFFRVDVGHQAVV